MDIQIRDVKSFAEGQNLLINRFYRDEAQSGATEKRRQLGQLLRACRRGEIDTVIIPALDRLSRNVRIAENLFHQFEELGVGVLIADMPGYDPKNRRDVLLRQIREAIAQENRGEIIERLHKGRQERVRQGKEPGGNVPYGYRRDGKRWVVSHEESGIVRSIFRLAAAGLAAPSISLKLNEQGFLRRNGRAWIARQVHEILRRRDLYEKGAITYGEVLGANGSLVLMDSQQRDDRELEIGVAL